ncbi:MAG TPA: EAL domain-containing protein [Acidobacteriaceae bacterium]|jgi:PAS domain S-box-containing protein|nr:EAL domain-containing protein [Acidobacteriaceae bacterium]
MLTAPTEVYRALGQGEFVPYFQPLVVLQTGQLAGFEVLARWKHPELGIIPPEKFIPLAEKDGWIGDLTQEILRQSFSSASFLPDSLELAVNISPVQLRDLSLPRLIQDVAAETRFPLKRLVLEITESAVMDNLEYAQTIGNDLKSMGCRLALDDFGTGYSSLLHLQSLPFDELKIDRSFVGSMTDRRDNRKIVAAVVSLGQSLGLTTVAEGVETEEQAEMLLWLGCDIGQGWLYGRPLPAEDLAAMISTPLPRIRVHSTAPAKIASVGNLSALPFQRLAQLQAVYDGAPVGLAFLDRNLRHVNLNQRLADLNGFSVSEHIGKTAAEMVPELFNQFEPFLERALMGEAIFNVEVKKPASETDGERAFLMSYQPARDEADEVVGISVALVDITEIKAADEALRQSKEKLQAVFDAIPIGIILAEAPDGRLSMANPEANRIFGHPDFSGMQISTYADSGLTRKDGTVLGPAEYPLARALLHGETTPPEDLLCESLDGSSAWVCLSGAPVHGPDGAIIGGVLAVQDIDAAKCERQRLLGMAADLMKELETHV